MISTSDKDDITYILCLSRSTELTAYVLYIVLSSHTWHTLFNENTTVTYIRDNEKYLRIQNMYAELIWKYLLYNYKFEQAVVRFSHIVQCLIVAVTIRTLLQTAKHHTDIVDLLIEKIEQQQMNITES